MPVLAVIGAALLVFLPLTWNASRVNLFTGGVIVAVIFLSLLIITGFAGQISLGQLAIVSFSSAVAGSMSQNGNELFTTILVAGLVGAFGVGAARHPRPAHVRAVLRGDLARLRRRHRHVLPQPRVLHAGSARTTTCGCCDR